MVAELETPLGLLVAASVRATANTRAVYTAIMGGSDVLRNPLIVERGVDYICFTDDKVVKSSVWNVVHVDLGLHDPAWVAKIAKVLPHMVLRGYTESIWVDGSILLCRPLWDLLKRHLWPATAAIGFFVHPNRACVYDEAAACIALKKDDSVVLTKQIDVYRRDCYPRSNGLIAGGFIYRRHSREVFDLMDRWLAQIQAHSKRDQISFNYVAWKEQAEFGVIKLNIFDNAYFVVMPHKSVAAHLLRSIWKRVFHWVRWSGLVCGTKRHDEFVD